MRDIPQCLASVDFRAIHQGVNMHPKNLLTRLTLWLVLALPAGAAQAVLLDFKLTGDYTASWQLESSPSPDFAEVGSYFYMFDVPGVFPGAVSALADIGFGNLSLGGGLAIEDFYGGGTILLAADGPEVYTGLEDAPTFILGTFTLREAAGNPAASFTLTISAVPEPQALALLLGGLVLVAAAARRARTAR
jgi:hypothetical protein